MAFKTKVIEWWWLALGTYCQRILRLCSLIVTNRFFVVVWNGCMALKFKWNTNKPDVEHICINISTCNDLMAGGEEQERFFVHVVGID